MGMRKRRVLPLSTAVHRSADGQKAPQPLHGGTIRTGAHFGAELPGGGEGGRNILC